MPGGHHGGHEQCVANGLATTADEALAAPLTGLAGPRGETDEGGDLLAAHAAELGLHDVNGVYEIAGDVTPADFPLD